MNTKTQSQDRLAKLLATENISVVRSNVVTASFDLKNRTLILPRWKEMTPEVEEMLMLHEVGHALFTSMDKYGVVFKDKKHLQEYANIIEDVRIEKKMKDRYPGSRKSFNLGYRELQDRDFFGVSKRDLTELLLIDKINLYYKVGYDCGVAFTNEEQPYLNKVDNCQTVDDVIKLAQEIFDFSKQKYEEEQEVESIEIETENEDDADDTGDRGASKRRENSIHDLNQFKDEYLSPITSDTFEENLSAHTDDTTVLEYYEPKFEIEYKASNIIPYRKVLEELDIEGVQSKWKIDRFKNATSPMVNYLVKEFEMKKSATSYKRARISKLGQLDSKKLFAYKLKDDLFRQVMRVEEGKKHGMIFLLDWSGSMCNCIEETLQQVLNLAMFCQRIQIPYQVFAFTDGYNLQLYQHPYKQNVKGIDSNCNFALLEFFSHKMTSVEFNKMLSCLLSNPFRRKNYGLNGTPLNESLLFMADYVGKFIRDNQVEKMSFITLTDGEGSTLHSSGKRIVNGSEYDHAIGKKIIRKSILKDDMTKKDYDLSSVSGEQTSMLLNLIRDRWGTKNIGFFLMKNSNRRAHEFLRHNVQNITVTQREALAEGIVDSLRKNKYCILNNVPGCDEYYLLPNDVQIDVDTEIEVDSDMNSGQLSRQLTKAFNSKKTSRVVLSKFIDQVS